MGVPFQSGGDVSVLRFELNRKYRITLLLTLWDINTVLLPSTKQKFPIWKLSSTFNVKEKCTALRVIAYEPLRNFGEQNPSIMPAISAWFKIAKSKDVQWKKPQDVVATFGAGRVDVLKNDRVCITLAGNQVRLILKVKYGNDMCFVRWVGWHKDYDTLADKIHSI